MSTLIDYIYVLSKRNVTSVYVPTLSLSDHYPVLVVRRCNFGLKANEERRNTTQYRSLTTLDETKFREGLPAVPWSLIEVFDDPKDTLALWYAMFDDIVDRHATLFSKGVKSLQLPPWMSTDILSTIRERDLLQTKAKNGVIPKESYKASQK